MDNYFTAVCCLSTTRLSSDDSKREYACFSSYSPNISLMVDNYFCCKKLFPSAAIEKSFLPMPRLLATDTGSVTFSDYESCPSATQKFRLCLTEASETDNRNSSDLIPILQSMISLTYDSQSPTNETCQCSTLKFPIKIFSSKKPLCTESDWDSVDDIAQKVSGSHNYFMDVDYISIMINSGLILCLVLLAVMTFRYLLSNCFRYNEAGPIATQPTSISSHSDSERSVSVPTFRPSPGLFSYLASSNIYLPPIEIFDAEKPVEEGVQEKFHFIRNTSVGSTSELVTGQKFSLILPLHWKYYTREEEQITTLYKYELEAYRQAGDLSESPKCLNFTSVCGPE